MGESKRLRWLGRLCVVLAVAPSCILAPGVALAQPADPATEARTRFQRGVELFEDGDAAGALLEFRRAYSIEPAYQVLYNIGKVEAVLRKYAAALSSFEEYLKLGGDQIDPKRRAEVEGEIAKLKTRVGMLAIASSPSGASVTVDDTPAGVTPITIRVRVGIHSVRVSKPGYAPLTLNVEVASLEHKDVKFDLVNLAPTPEPATKPPIPEPAPKKPEPTPPPPKKPVEDASTLGVMAAWIGTGVLFTGTVISGYLALSAKGDRDDKIDTLGTTSDEIESANDRAKTWALVSDIVGVSTVVMASLSLYLTLSADEQGRTTGLGFSPSEVRWRATF